ncbi:MAG: methyltransferase type 11, partial [Sulfurimicrobium sp.]|nr:methyltransferase type 11 [Sulfurimicrobium sp.]
APSRGPEHRYPVDCWRYYPDGYAALAKYGGLELLEVNTDWDPSSDLDSAPWGDTVGVFRKPAASALLNLRRRLMHRLRRWLLSRY